MFDPLLQFATGTGLPTAILTCGVIVLVIEAIRSSRRALWGDLFTEDFEE